jgi:hypothetical protein
MNQFMQVVQARMEYAFAQENVRELLAGDLRVN